ncbi:MAG: peptidoglycan DD-metalloendopeptidase family protein [Rhodobacteraceae bacterium]|nr:peptidoglycan DD-metalloendopeptidase family protein [Paracoccaceae bacterium]
MKYISKRTRIAALLLATGFLSACQGIDIPQFRVPDLGFSASAGPVIDRPLPDSRGVITYETYQVVVARTNDTVSSMAQRIGMPPEDLARHNGLSIGYAPRLGEVLALPRNVGGSVVGSPSGWTPDLAITAIDTATGGSIQVTEPSLGRPDEPLRHRVESGDSAYSIARLYNVSVTALASWNGLGPDLGVRIGQELIIPVPDTSRTTAAPVAPAATPIPSPTPTPTPTPLPVASVAPASSATGFVTPVDGTISRPYNQQAGRDKNDGIDYAVAAGSDVRVAADGVVALVSTSTGGLGTIVLVRHANDILTIYGRVDKVTVAKGDTVRRGQVIGVVAEGDPATMHFEVRKGTDSVDPAPYLR